MIELYTYYKIVTFYTLFYTYLFRVAQNVYNVLDNGGILLFRDYGLYDMAQLRFKPGHKISENLYMRQDGTRFLNFYLMFYDLMKLNEVN